jgi:predicted ATP-grasp superfamily ATP-dependent carboligase
MNCFRNPVIVLGSNIAAVSTLQTFRRRGVACWVADPVPCFARLSGGKRYHRIPNLESAELKTVEALIRLARTMAYPPVLLPAMDGYAQILARHRDVLAEVALPCAGSASGVDLVSDKRAFARWANQRVADFPETRDFDDIATLSDEWQPAVVKRAYHEWAGAFDRGWPSREDLHPFAFDLLRTPSDLLELRRKAGPLSEFLIIQKHIPGPIENGYSIGLYADREFEIRALFVGRKLRGWPLGGQDSGTATAAQNDIVPESVIDQVATLIKGLRLSGVVEVEYKKNEKTGVFHPIEINPRCWSWIGITAGIEADIAWSAYQHMVGNTSPAVSMNRAPGTHCYAEVLRDGYNSFVYYRRWAPERAPGIRKWLRFVMSKNTSTLEFRKGDWRMIFGLPMEGMMIGLRGLFGRLFRHRWGGLEHHRQSDP